MSCPLHEIFVKAPKSLPSCTTMYSLACQKLWEVQYKYIKFKQKFYKEAELEANVFSGQSDLAMPGHADMNWNLQRPVTSTNCNFWLF